MQLDTVHRWPLLYRWRPLIIMCILALAATARASDIWVVTDHEHPVQAPAGARVIELDAALRIQRDIFAHLPADRTQATAIAHQRLQQGGAELQRRMVIAYQAITDAWHAGVTKVPAVVVDQRYVVYGETNVELALSWIENYRRTHQ